jgi:uncharacterized protein (TIGR03118 family)
MKRHLLCVLAAAGFITLPLFSTTVSAAPAGYTVVNIVSDIGGVAARTDPDLINPWGMLAGPESVWVNSADSGITKAYNPAGKPFNFEINTTGGATGLAMNGTKSLIITNGTKHGPATFVMATESGTILAWNQNVTGHEALVMADRSGFGAVYKGVAIALWTNGLPRIYAANFHVGVIDVFDEKFQFLGSFTDPNMPAQYAPFNVQNFRGALFVAYAKQAAPALVEEEAGPGNGLVDIFDTDGTLLRRVTTGGALNAPWGMAIAPKNFGAFSSTLLIGNFGDGRINSYDLITGKYLGFLKSGGQPIEIEGLWALDFDQRENVEDVWGFTANRLYFTAGIQDEEHGLVGYIKTTGGSPFPFPH